MRQSLLKSVYPESTYKNTRISSINQIMGPPPNYLITRKLVRHFFKRYLPTQPINQTDYTSKLQDAIIQYGVDHQQTRVILDKIDETDEQSQKYRKKIADMKIKQRVMETLRRPQYHWDRKGRFRDDFQIREWNIYDGVK